MADFVRDVPKSHVLTLRWVMRDPAPDDAMDGPTFPADTVIRTAVHVAAATDKPIRVVDEGRAGRASSIGRPSSRPSPAPPRNEP